MRWDAAAPADPTPGPPKPGPGRIVEVVQSDRGITLKAESGKHDRVELRIGDVLRIGNQLSPITGIM